MTEPKRPGVPSQPEKKRPYEPPRIVWREDYEPVAFGVSCAKQPGNGGCVPPGPASG